MFLVRNCGMSRRCVGMPSRMLPISVMPVSCVAVDCFMHMYLGLAEVLGGLSAPLKGCTLEMDVSKGAADLRALLRARVQDMRSTAEREGATLDERNMCVTVDTYHV